MKASQFTDAQKAFIRKWAGMMPSEMKRVRELECKSAPNSAP